MEMAVGLIMATYFGAIVKSFVNDILMPPIGMLLGGVDFAELKYVLQPAIPESGEGAADGVAEVAVSYGLFINTILTFIIVAFAIFMVVKVYNRMLEKMARTDETTVPPAPLPPTKEEVLLTEIRDLLRK